MAAQARSINKQLPDSALERSIPSWERSRDPGIYCRAEGQSHQLQRRLFRVCSKSYVTLGTAVTTDHRSRRTTSTLLAGCLLHKTRRLSLSGVFCFLLLMLEMIVAKWSAQVHFEKRRFDSSDVGPPQTYCSDNVRAIGQDLASRVSCSSTKSFSSRCRYGRDLGHVSVIPSRHLYILVSILS